MKSIKQIGNKLGRSIKAKAPIKGSQHDKNCISIVSAVYGAEPYIDDFVESVLNQSIGFKHSIELILVDDCSVDGSYKKCLAWQKKYPRNIKVIRLEENQGQAVARNEGVKHAKHHWINFADPDDILHINFFRHLLSAAKANPDCDMFAGQLRSFYEETGKDTNDHPLGWRFKKGVWLANVWEDTNAVHFNVTTTIFKLSLIKEHNLTFDARTKPAFEDALFANQYTMRTDNPQRCFVEKARYHYRKRAAKTSTLDTAWGKKERFFDQIAYGCKAMMEEAKTKYGFIPAYIQNTAIYELHWFVRRLNQVSFEKLQLTNGELSRFKKVFIETASMLSDTRVLKFSTMNTPQTIRKQLVEAGGGTWGCFTTVNIIDVDYEKRLIRVCYEVANSEKESQLTSNDIKLNVIESKSVPQRFTDTSFVSTRYEWIEIPEENEDRLVELHFNKRPAIFTIYGRCLPLKPVSSDKFFDEIRALLLPAKANKKNKDIISSAERFSMWEQRNCWVFMDRIDNADDNAEHLYRYVKNNHPEINTFFVLSKSSKDWARLEADGFKLIEYGSNKHKEALINAKHLLSSHADENIYNILLKSGLSAQQSFQFHFLQHGTIKDDLSTWLNKKPIRTFVTSSPNEYRDITESERYSFSKTSVVLTGLPRHDALISKRSKTPTNKVISIMPTWRRWLSNMGADEDSSKFSESEFCKQWSELLNSHELRALNEVHEYEVKFYPHPRLRQHIERFNVPSYIKVEQLGDNPIQELFISSTVMITDYSSVAFDMAVLRKPVIYFQFDKERFFSGEHSYTDGYYDYETDGFGPCISSIGEMQRCLSGLPKLLPDIIKDITEPRAIKTMPYIDGRCCERVFEHISKL